MLKIIRVYIVFLLMGGLVILFTGKIFPFNFLGLSGMDVFNANSLRLTNWKITYYKKSSNNEFQLIPLTAPNGKSLNWHRDETLKYHAYFRTASFFQNNFADKKVIAFKLNTRLFFSRPALIDLCLHDPEVQDYAVRVISKLENFEELYRFRLQKSELPARLKKACAFIYSRRELTVLFGNDNYSEYSQDFATTPFTELKPYWNE